MYNKSAPGIRGSLLNTSAPGIRGSLLIPTAIVFIDMALHAMVNAKRLHKSNMTMSFSDQHSVSSLVLAPSDVLRVASHYL